MGLDPATKAMRKKFVQKVYDWFAKASSLDAIWAIEGFETGFFCDDYDWAMTFY